MSSRALRSQAVVPCLAGLVCTTILQPYQSSILEAAKAVACTFMYTYILVSRTRDRFFAACYRKHLTRNQGEHVIPLARIPIKNVGKCGTAGRLRVQGSYPTYPELLVLERRRPTSVILRTPAFLVFFCSTANPGCAPLWVVDYFKALADDTGLP